MGGIREFSRANRDLFELLQSMGAIPTAPQTLNVSLPGLPFEFDSQIRDLLQKSREEQKREHDANKPDTNASS